MRNRILASIGIVLAAAPATQAGTIDTGSASDYLPVGSTNWHGQTFLADDTILASFRFQVLAFAPGQIVFGEVYATAAGLPTGAPLYTSGGVVVAPTGLPAPLITFTPGLTIAPGTTYAIVIRAAAPGPLVGHVGNPYSSGTVVSTNNSGGVWSSSPGIDLATRIVMNPEPGTVALYGLGLLGLGVVVRRRRRASAAAS